MKLRMLREIFWYNYYSIGLNQNNFKITTNKAENISYKPVKSQQASWLGIVYRVFKQLDPITPRIDTINK